MDMKESLRTAAKVNDKSSEGLSQMENKRTHRGDMGEMGLG